MGVVCSQENGWVATHMGLEMSPVSLKSPHNQLMDLVNVWSTMPKTICFSPAKTHKQKSWLAELLMKLLNSKKTSKIKELEGQTPKEQKGKWGSSCLKINSSTLEGEASQILWPNWGRMQEGITFQEQDPDNLRFFYYLVCWHKMADRGQYME